MCCSISVDAPTRLAIRFGTPNETFILPPSEIPEKPMQQRPHYGQRVRQDW